MTKHFGIATKALIQNGKGKFLILYKSEQEEINPNSFDIPGGRLERGEKLEHGILREVKEETKIDISITKISRTRGFTKEDLHLVGITYLAKIQNNENTIKLSGEHNNYFWKTKDEILTGNFPEWLKEEIKNI